MSAPHSECATLKWTAFEFTKRSMRFGAQFTCVCVCLFVFAAAQMVDYQKTVAEHCAVVSLCKVCVKCAQRTHSCWCSVLKPVKEKCHLYHLSLISPAFGLHLVLGGLSTKMLLPSG